MPGFLRHPAHDYSSPCGYFLTLITRRRQPLFGRHDPERGVVSLNAAGRMIRRRWLDLRERFAAVELDAFVVMPDHLHGVVIVNCTKGASRRLPLPTLMDWFKAVTTMDYFYGVREHGWPRVDAHLWQRSYYDHIIRSESELQAFREYVLANPGALSERRRKG